MNALALQARDSTSGEDVHREVQRERTRVKQIERPEIDGAARQVCTARRLRHNR